MDAALKRFRRIFVSREAEDTFHGRTIVLRAAAAGIPVEVLANDAALANATAHSRTGTLVVQSTPAGGWVKRAEHGLLADRIGERYLNPIEGCQSGCTYCYLRSRPLGLHPIRLNVATDQFFNAITEDLGDGNDARIYCTGELADSLAEIEIYPIAALLARYFNRNGNARLELRTKSDCVDPLLSIDHGGKTTIAFSIAPQANVEAYEPGTASLLQRVAAASRCQAAGYPIALKFEPIIMTPDWQTAYTDALDLICSTVRVAELDHVSIGCLRWSERLAATPTFAKRHQDAIAAGTWIEYRPGIFNATVRKDERIEVYDWLRVQMRRRRISAPIWWSLEEAEVIAEMERRDQAA